MKRLIDLGIMVGSSADGADLVAAVFSDHSCQILAHYHWSFSVSMQQRLKTAAIALQPPYHFKKSRYLQLEADLTSEIIAAVETYEILEHFEIAQVSYHGFTLFHQPLAKLSWQLGDLLKLAQRFSCPVIGDFRQRIIENGGMGAPLIPLFHRWLTRKRGEQKALFLNLGGISNLSVIDKQELWGTDIGPGNCLSDLISQEYFALPYDSLGEKASRGQRQEGIEHWLERFFADKLPSVQRFSQEQAFCLSTQDFQLSLLRDSLKKEGFCPYDLLLTSHYYVFKRVSLCLPKHFCSVLEVFGGGAFNQIGLHVLNQMISPVQVRISSFHPQAIESLGFAWLGHQCLRQIPHRGSLVGSTEPVLIGSVVKPGDYQYPQSIEKMRVLEDLSYQSAIEQRSGEKTC